MSESVKKWYVVRAISGNEKKVKHYLEHEIANQNLQDNISQVLIPTEKVYMIRNGKIAEMVKDVILAGNLFETLMNIDAIGNDFQWQGTAGGCGKGNQFPLPVAMGAPHIRIQNVVIGGE